MSNADIRGRFIWHELMTTDPDAAAAFYSKVVPWKTQDSGMPSYTLWMAGKTQIGGLMALPDGADASAPPHWIVYVGTTDVDATVVEAERLGGKVLKSASDIPNTGRFAVLADPQGAAFAVYTPAGAAPEAPSQTAMGEFGWHELHTTDYEAATRFYSELFGWEKGPAHDMGSMGIYQIVNHHGSQVGGVFNVQSPSMPPHWLSYVRVADATKAAATTKAAGGKVLHGPMEVPGGSWITMIMDPQGGEFAVVEPPAAGEKPAAAKPAKATPAKSGAKKAAKKTGKQAAKKPGRAAAKKPDVAKRKSARGKAAKKKAVAKKSAAGKGAARKRPVAKRATAKSARRGKSAAKRGSATSKGAKRKGGAKRR